MTPDNAIMGLAQIEAWREDDLAEDLADLGLLRRGTYRDGSSRVPSCYLTDQTVTVTITIPQARALVEALRVSNDTRRMPWSGLSYSCTMVFEGTAKAWCESIRRTRYQDLPPHVFGSSKQRCTLCGHVLSADVGAMGAHDRHHYRGIWPRAI